MKYLMDTATYTALLFSLSVALLLCLPALGPVPPPHTPGVVDKADSWPKSKAKHMEEGDFWYSVEQAFDESQGRPSSWRGWLFASAMGTDATLRTARTQMGLLDEFHEFEMFVWCLFLPTLTFGLIGAGLAAWWRPLSSVTHVSWTALATVALMAVAMPSEQVYHVLWEASIRLSNLAGVTYYDFTVWFFVYLPALVMGAGLALLLVKALSEVLAQTGWRPTP
jgi:hypothetical protein